MQQASSSEHESPKRSSPSAERNKEPIWNVLQSKVLPSIINNPSSDKKAIRILEVAAGAGVHVHHFVGKLLELQGENDALSSFSYQYQPTDSDPSSLASQQAYLDELSLQPAADTLVDARPPLPLTLDETGVCQAETARQILPQQDDNDWWDAIVNINMIHISPWTACQGLMQLAGTHLRPGTGMLYLYGPYRVGGTCVESNVQFEKWLQSLNASYGVRDLEKVVELAEQHGLELVETIEMPANNLSVLLRRKQKQQQQQQD